MKYSTDLYPTVQALIETIFDPGMTTTTQVSQLSGRGIGLYGVRLKLEAIGGSISVSVKGEINPGFYVTEFVICLPKEAIRWAGKAKPSRIGVNGPSV